LHTFFLNFAKLIDTAYAANNFLPHTKMIPLKLTAIAIQTIQDESLRQKQLSLDVLRLDKIHDIVSGNKWFKLKYYLREATATSKTTIATFGGAWSNHVVATAFATKEMGLKSLGIIRGEKPATLSSTLREAIHHGMKILFVSREQYQHKEALIKQHTNKDYFWINEGGYGPQGARGATEILKTIDASVYTHIIAAVGTGTMLAGLILSANTSQDVIGISSMKGNYFLEEQVQKLLPPELHGKVKILHDYHMGGYAKHSKEIIDVINHSYNKYDLPLDIVYTGKTFFAVKDLAERMFFKQGSRILMIHSGGLQGNASLSSKVDVS
jgi:1-aminocyclopropane-1-carboxylate deaminase